MKKILTFIIVLLLSASVVFAPHGGTSPTPAAPQTPSTDEEVIPGVKYNSATDTFYYTADGTKITDETEIQTIRDFIQPAAATTTPAAATTTPAAATTTSGPQQIGGGGATTPPPPTPPAPGTTPTTTTAQPTPTESQENVHIYRGEGTLYQVYDQPLTTPPEGYSYDGAYTLTTENLMLIAEHQGDETPLTTIEDNKVVFTNPDGTIDVSIGPATFTNWPGADEFEYDSTDQSYSYAGRNFAASYTETQPILDDEGRQISGHYIDPLAGEGVLIVEGETATIYDTEGNSVMRTSEWGAWEEHFSTIDEANYVETAFAINDLSIDPEDVQISTAQGIYGEGFSAVRFGNEFRVRSGDLTGEYTEERYTIVDGEKQISELAYVSDEGTTRYTYAYEEGDVFSIDNQPIGTMTKYDGFDDPLLALGTVNGVDIVRDEDGDIRYFRNRKELSDAAADKFEEGLNEANQKRLDGMEEENGQVAEAESERYYQELPPNIRERFYSVGQFAADFVNYYQRYAGLAGWTSIIWDDSKALKEWREKVNDFFCNIGGVGLNSECWTSKICGKYSDIKPTRDGVLFSAPIGGMPRALAHIEAQRSLPIEKPDGTEWIYTATFGITNPHDEPMSYNVRFVGNAYSAYWWHEGWNILQEGGSASAKGASALMKISSKNYHTVCLDFDPAIIGFDGKEVDSMCKGIAQYTGVGTAPYGPETEEEAEEAGQPETPSDPGAAI